jgi:hypothetical protein
MVHIPYSLKFSRIQYVKVQVYSFQLLEININDGVLISSFIIIILMLIYVRLNKFSCA